MIRESRIPYKLTAMSTIIETETMEEALKIVQNAHDLLAEGSERIYSSINIDIRKSKSNRLTGKISSVENKIGKVNK